MSRKTVPFLIAAALIAGILIGTLYERHSDNQYTSSYIPDTGISSTSKKSSSFTKLNTVLEIINSAYVDEIDKDKITEEVLPEILKELDPHSTYLPRKEAEEAHEDLDGSFCGIGVQFNIQNDTIMVVDVISGGPSEKLGLQPGDRIVTVDDSCFTGPTITNTKVMRTLRGPKGTKVKVGIARSSSPDIIYYTIVRDDIPVNSIDIAYAITDKVGYVKVSRFGLNTDTEFRTALADLRNKGCDSYIIDLRYNSGGYLNAVINMLNELLERNELIVYTEGRAYPRDNAYADGRGRFKSNKVCVLINEWSASASEIFSGAIQDQDRGWIIGRRSFGKGLVQQPITLADSSEIRLTIARYYTPSGRCIQKPYEAGHMDEYNNDIEERYESGEIYHDSLAKQSDTIKYYTRKLHRVVYGGGGISPDFFIAQDTSAYTKLYRQLVNKSIIYGFAFRYSDTNRSTLRQYKDWKSLTAYLRSSNYWNEFISYAESKGITIDRKELAISEQVLRTDIEALVSRNILGDGGYYPVMNRDDKMVLKALEVIGKELQ